MTVELDKPHAETARWKAVIYYRTDNGSVDVEHGIEELEELQDIVERGPDWNTVERIVVTLDRKTSESLTVEESLSL